MQSKNDKIVIDGAEYDLSDIDLSEKDLNTALSTQAGKYMFCATKAAEWTAEREALEYALESTKAKAYLDLKDNFLRSGLKKPTEYELEARVQTTQSVQHVIGKLNRARLIELQWKALERGYAQRKDAAQEMSKNMRTQYGSID